MFGMLSISGEFTTFYDGSNCPFSGQGNSDLLSFTPCNAGGHDRAGPQSPGKLYGRMIILGTGTVPGKGFLKSLIIIYFCLASQINLGEMDMQ
jgi:hypothetical protein